jgi:hypothetical protein
MTKSPEPPAPIRWEIFKIAKKSVWVGSVEAHDEATAGRRWPIVNQQLTSLIVT